MKQLFQQDWLLIAPVFLLVVISLCLLLSINSIYFKSQLLSLCISLFVFFIFSQINFSELAHFILPVYIISLILLFIVLLIGIQSHGAIRWISILGVQLQFSEILKPFLALSFAGFLSRKPSPSLVSLFTSLLFLSPIIYLLYRQPDLGNAIIYAGAAFLTLIIVGFPVVWFGLGALPVVLSLPVLWNVLHAYQRQRILTFLHPASDPLGASYNGIQAVIAVGSGSFLGKGLSEGTQAALRFLPERQTDFIFATLSEDLGFVGAVLLICLFAYFCYRIYLISRNAKTSFGRIFAVTACIFFMIQFMMNVGMNMGIVPVVGVTLPFVSFGGSSLLANFIFLGLLSSLSKQSRTKEVLEIR